MDEQDKLTTKKIVIKYGFCNNPVDYNATLCPARDAYFNDIIVLYRGVLQKLIVFVVVEYRDNYKL